MVHLAAGAMKLLVLPNAEAERVFSSVTLTKNDIRNRMSDEVLVSIFKIKFGLQLRNINCSDFVITQEMIAKVNSTIYA